ncbi:hypothetical protein A1O7_09878 [Cladophialophora yegresii CBS 114405]|uniref:SET domain-containing protein n=1 Tax=Cladophialophora yegresii CBS 114405 TaxID=1182544 RepID=W9VGD0_9EURO|nr:uncharacterized protein A1O7_09878 [Cladophialophora yegresii CBS 114405]EXJ54538.1 hypothetical protein A1O7_09878 [Cladophialophora yegresii CBS 114405]
MASSSATTQARWRQAPHGKGYGFFASRDFNAGEEIFLEPGFGVVPESPQDFSPPFPGPDRVGDVTFAAICLHITEEMCRLYHLMAEPELSRGNLGCTVQEAEFLLTRPGQTPLYDRIVVATRQMRSLDTTIRKSIVRMAVRFFSDAGEYKVHTGDVEDNSSGFGFMTGSMKHSCQPNAELHVPCDTKQPDTFKKVGWYRMQTPRLAMLLQATRRIKGGEEITISYDRVNDHFPESRESRLEDIKRTYGFNCRCDACICEENDSLIMRLKDDVLRLLKDFEDFEEIPAPKMYRRAAYILDGLAELGVDDCTVTAVWDMCAERAWSCCDMIRAHWFATKALEHGQRMYGGPATKRPETLRAYVMLGQSRNNEGLGNPDIQGYSAVPTDGYDVQQADLEKLMFALKHTNAEMYYPCLQLVDGRVQEISRDANRRRLAKIQAEREKRREEIRAGKTAEQEEEKLYNKTVEEVMSMLEESPAGRSRKKRQKQRVRRNRDTKAAKVAREGTTTSTASTSKVALGKCLGPIPPFHSRFTAKGGDPEGVSKQEWHANALNMDAVRVNKARDIGHLLAAKDGYAIKNESYVLSTRRDSVCVRVEGRRELVGLGAVALRRARTHSFGNDQGRWDMLKMADVRESNGFWCPVAGYSV